MIKRNLSDTQCLHKRVLLFKLRASKYQFSALQDVDQIVKLFILKIYSGLKRAGTFDCLSKKHPDTIKQIVSLLGDLKMHYKLIGMNGNIKIIFSMSKNDVQELSSLHYKVFTKHMCHNRYGELLGFSSCCRLKFQHLKRHKESGPFPIIKGGVAFSQRLWAIDYRLNMFAGVFLMQHVPCSIKCKKTLLLADKTLELYNLYDSCLAKRIVNVFLKKPVLIFNENYYVKFDGKIENKSISYSNNIREMSPAFLGQGLVSLEDLRVSKIVDIIKKGNKIIFREDDFKIYKNGRLLMKNKFDEQPFLIIDFYQEGESTGK